MNAVVESSDFVHRLGHHKRGIFLCKVVENMKSGGRKFLEESMSKEKWNERIKCDGGIDKVEDGSPNERRSFERTNSGKIFEGFANEFSMFLERRL